MLDHFHNKLKVVERDLNRHLGAPTFPIYDVGNLPQDAINGQIALGTDGSLNWYFNDMWNTYLPLSSVSINNVPQDVINGQIVIGTDNSLCWLVNDVWYSSPGTLFTGGPQDVVEGQIAVTATELIFGATNQFDLFLNDWLTNYSFARVHRVTNLTGEHAGADFSSSFSGGSPGLRTSFGPGATFEGLTLIDAEYDPNGVAPGAINFGGNAFSGPEQYIYDAAEGHIGYAFKYTPTPLAVTSFSANWTPAPRGLSYAFSSMETIGEPVITTVGEASAGPGDNILTLNLDLTDFDAANDHLLVYYVYSGSRGGATIGARVYGELSTDIAPASYVGGNLPPASDGRGPIALFLSTGVPTSINNSDIIAGSWLLLKLSPFTQPGSIVWFNNGNWYGLTAPVGTSSSAFAHTHIHQCVLGYNDGGLIYYYGARNLTETFDAAASDGTAVMWTAPVYPDVSTMSYRTDISLGPQTGDKYDLQTNFMDEYIDATTFTGNIVVTCRVRGTDPSTTYRLTFNPYPFQAVNTRLSVVSGGIVDTNSYEDPSQIYNTRTWTGTTDYVDLTWIINVNSPTDLDFFFFGWYIAGSGNILFDKITLDW